MLPAPSRCYFIAMTEAVDVFDDPLLASVYDDLDPWAASDEFYLGLAREIGGAVLDLGCGTGRLACRIAAEGLEVVGADPAGGMLGVARARPPSPETGLAWVSPESVKRMPIRSSANMHSVTCLYRGGIDKRTANWRCAPWRCRPTISR